MLDWHNILGEIQNGESMQSRAGGLWIDQGTGWENETSEGACYRREMSFLGTSYKAIVLVAKQGGLNSDFKVRNQRIFFSLDQYPHPCVRPALS